MVRLDTEQDRKLYWEIYEAVASRCEAFYEIASFQVRDEGIIDAAFRAIRQRLDRGEIRWEERAEHIRRYVSVTLARERRNLSRQERRFVQPTEEYDPLSQVEDPSQDPYEIVLKRFELERLVQEQAQRLREERLLEARLQAVAATLPQRERARFVAVLLKAHLPSATYEEVSRRVGALGYPPPKVSTLRQWQKRYESRYRSLLAAAPEKGLTTNEGSG